MRRRAATVVVCVSLAVLVAAAMAQQLGPQAPSAGSASNNAPDPFAQNADSTQKPEPVVVQPGLQNNATAEGLTTLAATARDPAKSGPVNVLGTFAFVVDTTQAVNELIEKWKQAGNKSDRDKVQQSLHAALKEQFRARLEAHEKEIEQLEAQVKRLSEQLELRRKKQDEIVKFRLEQLLREAQGLGWGTEPVTQTSRAVLNLTTSPNSLGIISLPSLPGSLPRNETPAESTAPGSNFGAR